MCAEKTLSGCGHPAIVGVLGGMGPHATAAFFLRLIRRTPATCDQEHLHVLIDNDPGIPDRTAAILGDGASPLTRMLAAAQRLAAAGATLIAMPCNTAHVWLEELRRGVDVPIVDMVEETSRAAAQAAPASADVGLLATTGTVRSGLYARTLERLGRRLIVPTEEDQRVVAAAIARVKADDAVPRGALVGVCERLVDRGAAGLILGCTEIPLVLSSGDVAVAIFDSMDLLARSVVKRCTGGSERTGSFGGE